MGERTGIVSKTPLGAGSWQHVAVVRSETSIALFTNAELEAMASLADYTKPAPELYDERRVTRLGSAPGGRAPFNGLIDEVAVFLRALTVADLNTLARATSAAGR